ncbi:hypothetical protein ACOMHN_058005 [Nucella lapillus]
MLRHQHVGVVDTSAAAYGGDGRLHVRRELVWGKANLYGSPLDTWGCRGGRDRLICHMRQAAKQKTSATDINGRRPLQPRDVSRHSMVKGHHSSRANRPGFCDNDDNIDKVCGTITGDFQLHTIVKVSGNPIPCPFQGPYTFSYSNESEDRCTEPPSEIHACADKSKFIFRYKRCKRIPHTQDVELSFQCFAMWFNGEYFLYGKFSSTGRQVIKKMYRCFGPKLGCLLVEVSDTALLFLLLLYNTRLHVSIFAKMYILYGTRGEMSMSQDATCQGLSSPHLGMNTFELVHQVDQWPRPSCVFPNFLWRSGAWRDVGGEWRMTVEANNEELAIHTLIHPDFLTPGEHSPETQIRVRCLDQVLDQATPMSPALREVHVLTYATNHSW